MKYFCSRRIELLDARDELDEAEGMFANAGSHLRSDEAAYRIKAAKKRIAAVVQEARDERKEEK